MVKTEDIRLGFPVKAKPIMEREITGKLIAKISLGIVGLILLFVVVFGSWFVVHPGEGGIVFNVFTGLKPTIYHEGLHLKVPVIDQAIKMNLRTQKQQETATAASKDLQDTSTEVAVNFYIEPSKLLEVYRTIGQATTKEDYMQTQIMNPIIQESVKQITATYTAEELISKRPLVKTDIDTAISYRLKRYGINVVDVSITNFKFSDQFTKAIEEKVTAEQNALKEQNNLRVVQFQAQQKVEAAKGDAESIRIVTEELQRSPEYVSFLTISKWNGVMPLALGSGSLISIAPQFQNPVKTG
jgi:regulator of protease activity HflC (stomatin/prohibitin superfamily)